MTPKRFAELKQAVTDFPYIGPTNAEAREMIEEIEKLRKATQEAYSGGYQAARDGGETNILDDELDTYLDRIVPAGTP